MIRRLTVPRLRLQVYLDPARRVGRCLRRARRCLRVPGAVPRPEVGAMTAVIVGAAAYLAFGFALGWLMSRGDDR